MRVRISRPELPDKTALRLSHSLNAGAIVFGLVLCFLFVRRASWAGEDSWFPMGRALDFIRNSPGGSVYESLFFLGHVKFQYPPTALLSIDMLNWIGIGTPYEYNLINAGLLIVTGVVFSVFVSQVVGSFTIGRIRLPVGSLSFLVAMLYYPQILAFRLGQMQIVLGLIFLLACLALLHDKRILCGCLIALAASVKPQFLPLGLLALWNRDWRFVGGMAVVTMAIVATSIDQFGWYNHVEYLKVLSFLSQHSEYHRWNQSIQGILVRFLYRGPSLELDPAGFVPQSAFPPCIPAAHYLGVLSSVVLISVPFFLLVRGDRMTRLLNFCLAATLFTMASPIAWVHHYNVLLPAYPLVLRVILDRQEDARLSPSLIWLGASAVLTGYAIVPRTIPITPLTNLLLSQVLLGAGILVALLLVEVWKRRETDGRSALMAIPFVTRPPGGVEPASVQAGLSGAE